MVLSVTKPVMVTIPPFLVLLDELLSAELTEDELEGAELLELVLSTLLDELLETRLDELVLIAVLVDELDIAGVLEAVGVWLEDPPPPPPHADKVNINAINKPYRELVFMQTSCC